MASNKYFLSHEEPRLDQDKLDSFIRHALIEDIGTGDITTTLTIPKDKEIEARISAKEKCIVCGLEVAERVFKILDKKTAFKRLVKEGQRVNKGTPIIKLQGKAHSILSAERVSLNLLSMLSGTATKTRDYVEKVKPHKVKITDTRKTIPGLREMQKYAVRIGGGFNHRMALDEMIIIKDNHLQITEGYDELPKVPKGYKIEIEVENIKEFKHAIRFKPDVIMLDNMGVDEIKEAVKIRNGITFDSHHPMTLLETSGGIDIENVKQVAATGVDIISIGDLTHSVQAIDMSLEVV